MRRKFSIGSLFLLLLSLIATVSFAQNRQIRGKVVDNQQKPLSDVTVIVTGTNTYAVTDSNGVYHLTISPKAKDLSFSLVGFKSLSVPVKDDLTVSLSLGDDLSNVVVVAYGTQRKTNITGAITSIKGDLVANKAFSSVDKALQGNVAGLQISSASGAPGSATDIRIRGIGSINASSSPLWVIDGVIANSGDLTTNTTTANALSSLNPNDIESISVLKDASAASIYGSRAANGVIIVTTKRGKAGKTGVDFHGEMGANSIAYKSDANHSMSTSQYLTAISQALVNGGYASNTADAEALAIDPVDGFGLKKDVNTDWRKVVTRNGAQRQFNLSMNGGNEKTQFYTSAGYYSQQGTTIATDYNRYNGSMSITHHATNNLLFTTGLNGSFSTQHTPLNGGNYSNPLLSANFLLPWYTPYNADGTLKYNDADGEFPAGGGIYNPLIQAAWNNNSAKTFNLRGYVSGEYKILKDLKFTSRFSSEYYNIEENIYQNPFYGDGYPTGYAYGGYNRTFSYTWSNFADYHLNLNDARDIYVDIKAGYEAQRYRLYKLYADASSFPQTLALQYLSSAATPTTTYNLPEDNATTSYFSNAALNIKDRYVLTGSFRRDGSSVFSKAHRWGNFYSVGGTWNINNEEFLKNINVFSLLKLRASYGENGNSLGFGNYSSLATYSAGYNYGGDPGIAPNNVGNPDLTWEKNKIFDLGLDFGFFANRLSGSFDYYNRATSDLLLSVPLSLVGGFGSQLQNIGSMRNRGFEFTISGKPIVSQNFKWDVSFNIAHNTNKVTALYLDQSFVNPNNSFNLISVGKDVQSFYMRQWAGVDPSNGDPLWYSDETRTTTTNSYSAAPQMSYRSATPKYYGGFTNTFTYKNLSLSAQVYYNYGNYVYDVWGRYTNSDGLYYGSFGQSTLQLNAWQKDGDITNTPKLIYGGNKNSYNHSSRYLYNGGYVRLRDVTLTYNLPDNLVSKWHLAGVSVFVHGTNLITIVKDKNIPFDPESGVSSQLNYNVYIPKTITGGVNIRL